MAGSDRIPTAADLFPPITPRATSADDLAMLAASQTGRAVLPVVLNGTHSDRANYPASLFDGAVFIETDRLVMYLATGGNWVYAGGQWDSTLSNIPTLTTTDVGYRFGVTDYAHILRWSGSAWGWAPGDGGSGMGPVLFEINPGTGWALYDGSTVAYLKADGTTANVTLPDLTSAANKAAFLEGGGTNSGPTAAVAPGISGSVAAAATGVTTNAAATGISVTTSGTTDNDSGGGTVVAAGAGTTVASHTHNHGVPGLVGTVTDPTHSHGINDPTHTHAIGTLAVDATGEPRKIIRRPYFRQ